MEPIDILKEQYPRLTARAVGLQMLDDYYTGEHPLPFITKAHAAKMHNAFRQMLDESRSNFMRLLIDVVDERLKVEGIRLSANSDIHSDKESWDIWQDNGMDSLHRSGILDSLIMGFSYFSVWPDEKMKSGVKICIEDPRETMIIYTPGSNFRERDAAIKAWKIPPQMGEKDAKVRANVWTPTTLSKFVTKGENASWEPFEEPYDHDFGVVPVIPMRNKPRTLIEGESEIADSWRVQNQINGFLFLLALAGYFGAHKQRWATGIKLFEDEETGKVEEPWDIAIDKMLIEESETAKFGEFSQTDLDGYLKAIDQKVAHLAITTRTPKHYLLPDGQDPSGDAIQSAESGLNKRAERKQESGDDCLEEVMKLARHAAGLGDTPVDSEMVWADPATVSEAVRTDAVLKKFTAQLIPAEQALEDLGYSQTAIARIMKLRAADKLLESFAPSPDKAASENLNKPSPSSK